MILRFQDHTDQDLPFFGSQAIGDGEYAEVALLVDEEEGDGTPLHWVNPPPPAFSGIVDF
ncbi:MAG: hypothetical protein JSU61_05055 [Fidelibacterota bacterium]|nr:MAG: hypothetical protein JSU61_05055 [Candidatus Neomarinimicrobiota bacterium]